MNPAIVNQIRWSTGEVSQDGDQLRISDDPDRVLRDVLLFALEAMSGDVQRLLVSTNIETRAYAVNTPRSARG